MKRLGEYRVINGARFELTIPEPDDDPPGYLPESQGTFDSSVNRLIALGFLTYVGEAVSTQADVTDG